MTKRLAPRGRARKKAQVDYFAHPQALVEEGALIGAGSRVWAFAHVLPGAVVGADCNLCDHVLIEGGATLGNQVTVKSGVYVWEGVHAEDGVFLGPNSTFTNDLVPRSFVTRAKNAWLRPTFLRHGCTIGANATILCGHTVGRFALVGAGAVVTDDVPDHGVVVGVPARLKGWICRCGAGLTLKTDRVSCRQCRTRYRKTETGLAPLTADATIVAATRRRSRAVR